MHVGHTVADGRTFARQNAHGRWGRSSYAARTHLVSHWVNSHATKVTTKAPSRARGTNSASTHM